MLDNRLSLCYEFTEGKYFCDVGTDHAYLPAELIISGKCEGGIASDIRRGPLKAAAATLERYGISDKVQLICSDGLKNISISGINDIIIAGMGGEMIVKILDESPRKAQTARLILQPMTRAAQLRKYLCRSGYYVIAEKAAADRKFCYTAIKAVYTGEISECDDISAEIGFMDFSEENARRYAVNRLNVLEKAAAGAAGAAGAENPAAETAAAYRKLCAGIRERLGL